MSDIIIKTVRNETSIAFKLGVGNITLPAGIAVNLFEIVPDDLLLSIQPELEGLEIRKSITVLEKEFRNVLRDKVLDLEDEKAVKTTLITTVDLKSSIQADAPVQTGTYVQADVEAIRVLANDLKAKYNAAVTLINELKSIIDNMNS